MKTRHLKFLALIFLFSACVKNTSDIRATFASADTRVGLLSTRVNELNKALYWQDEMKLAFLITPGAKSQITKKLKERRGLENLVDTEIEDIKFDKELMHADVMIKTRFFKIAHNIVQEKFEKQVWAYYRFDGGWKLTDIIPQYREDTVL